MDLLDEPYRKIYPRSVSGRFTNWRWGLIFFTQLVFYGVPWLQWGQRQAVLFDLEARRFFIFGLVLLPQDFIYLTGLLVISALSLFLMSAVAGRVWCGFGCPHTVYTEILAWFEKLTEGDRSARMRRDAGPWSAEKVRRKACKHGLWVAFSLWTGLTFVGYFTPIYDLSRDFLQFHMGSWATFWALFYGFATYGNAGFMREQVCNLMCPYARFQSAMFDKETLMVSYDARRGEPRGARSKRVDPVSLNLGACVDCSLCLQVCPTGIDIRKGLQYECIGCGACADVCNTVMDKLGYARGLVSYATKNAGNQRWTRGQLLRLVLRPRVLVYTAILGAAVVVVTASLALQAPFKVDVVSDRGSLARVVSGGSIENVYRLQVMNAAESTQHFDISVHGLPELTVVSEDNVTVAPTEARWMAVRIQAPFEAAAVGPHTIYFDVVAQGGARVSEKSVFIVPH